MYRLNRTQLVFIFLILVGLFLLLKQKPTEVHHHAGFVVFKDSEKIDFSDMKYMLIEPCEEEEHEEGEENEQLEKAHLHDGIGYVVHVHRKKVIWRDLFTNINYNIPNDVVAYSNGQVQQNILDKPIKKHESVIFFVGKNENIDSKRKDTIPVEEIKRVEDKGESC